MASFGLREVTSRSTTFIKRRQVAVLDYKSEDDFIVALKPKDRKRANLSWRRLLPAETLQKTIETVRSRIKATTDLGESSKL